MRLKNDLCAGCLLAVASTLSVPFAHAVFDRFEAPTYVDGELTGQSGWGSALGGFIVTQSAADGRVRSVVSPGAVKSIPRNLSTANTGVAEPNPTGTYWARCDLTLYSTSGTANLFTLDLLRDVNFYKAVSFNVYQDGKVILIYNTGNVPAAQVNVSLPGLLTNGVEAVFHFEIDFDNRQCRFYKDYAIIDLPSDPDDWIPFADRRGMFNFEPDDALNLGYNSLINRNLAAGYVVVDNVGFGTGVASPSLSLKETLITIR